jgi:hypothetical protein
MESDYIHNACNWKHTNRAANSESEHDTDSNPNPYPNPTILQLINVPWQ